MNELIKEIASFIIKETQDNSILSGFQYETDFTRVLEVFGQRLDQEIKNSIIEELETREEVAQADLEEDFIFDVTLFTDYAPNYNKEDYEEE